MNNKLKERINELIHDIYSRSLLGIDILTDEDIEIINCDIFYIFNNLKKYYRETEDLISELKKENERLGNELLISETALNKVTKGNIHKAMDDVTIKDIFFKIES